MNLPEYAMGTLSDLLEQRLDTIEQALLAILDRQDVIQESWASEIEEVRANYQTIVDLWNMPEIAEPIAGQLTLEDGAGVSVIELENLGQGNNPELS